MKMIFSNARPEFSYIRWSIFGIFKSINEGSPGLKNAEIMEFGGLGLSKNKTDILLDQKWSK